MSAVTKKPPAAGMGRLSDGGSTTTAPRTARSSPSPSATAAPARTRSTRTTTPVSARAAAHRTSSSLSISASEADEAARAETVALIEDLKARLDKSDTASEQFRKQTEVLQSRLDDAIKEQAKLEERVHESEEQIETLRNEKRESARQMREMETIYEAERSSMLKEKEEMSNREEEMQVVINRLKDTINQRNAEDESRPSRQLNNNSPGVDNGSFAPPSSVHRSDSRNNSKLLLQKDKLIESLRLELAEAQIKLVESENQGGGRLHEVERLLMEARMANARLMEDNESYQLLLQEKTLHGDFGKGDFSYMGSAANQDALNALEGRSSYGGEKKDADGTALGASLGASLADELGDAADDTAVSTVDDTDHQRRLEGELRALKDQNKALTLYINKIIERLLQHQEFEHILDQSTEPKANTNKDLPAPPAADRQSAGASLLARAKSMATGGSNQNTHNSTNSTSSNSSSVAANSNRHSRPRPVSYMPSTNSAHNNPDTAPSIPIGLGRAQSTRRQPGSRPMSEQFSGGAGFVNAMYKGPDGPLSPTLSTGRNSAQFFSGPSTPRSGAPTAGNFPGMRSETSSVSGESAGGDNSNTSVSMSPPRTIGSGHEKEKGGNATFIGNKPRPLRLVQENAPQPETTNKRASWFGWAGLSKSADGGNTEAIKE